MKALIKFYYYLFISQVNDILLSPMTHEEAVIFMRQAADTVKLRLYRDVAQTPTTTISPSSSESRTFANTLKTRAHLRYVMTLIYLKIAFFFVFL